MLIYKIFRAAEWQGFQANGSTKGAPIDLKDGYIHFSTAEQVRETAAKHFSNEANLMLLALDADGLSDLKWEPSRGGAMFPHLYGVLQIADILWAKPLLLTESGHDFAGMLT